MYRLFESLYVVSSFLNGKKKDFNAATLFAEQLKLGLAVFICGQRGWPQTVKPPFGLPKHQNHFSKHKENSFGTSMLTCASNRSSKFIEKYVRCSKLFHVIRNFMFVFFFTNVITGCKQVNILQVKKDNDTDSENEMFSCREMNCFNEDYLLVNEMRSCR